MKAYEYRAVIEREELGAKVDKLSTFLKSDEFNKLSDEHQSLIRGQLDVMCVYMDFLSQRINLFIEE